ncbi:MAG TPA: hypothetical protein VD735_02550, partial [Candidatus Saccharimonadales bacterium]|nr:hypothetical protein [Candidatus Saccharimonadales bacterium]
RPSADIRLSSELSAAVRTKIIELGLDPADTTGPELYKALHARLHQDELRLQEALRIAPEATANEVVLGVQKFLSGKKIAGTCFAIKGTSIKKLLKKKIPKNVMKALGYRSFDSMVKHEQMSAIYAAAMLVESHTWHRNFRELYAKLGPSDFEQRTITITAPKTKRWHTFAEKYVSATKHNIICFKELGAVVLLPIEQKIDGLAITSMLLALHYMNDIRSYSSYMKLQQVRPGFGKSIEKSAYAEPMTSASLAGQAVPWKVIQRYYGKLTAAQHPEVFEPHVQPEDLQWKEAEDVLISLEPSLAFWRGTQYVCALHDDQPVSMNILDVALGYCNNLRFDDRIVHFVRQHLWHELMGRYMHQENLEAAVHRQLSIELVPAPALAEFN